MKRELVAFGMAALAGAGASGQVFEGFEHGNESLYGFAWTTVDNMSLTAAAAHTGSFGAEFDSTPSNAWRTRFDLATSPGHSYFAHCRVRSGTGRLYLGIGADSTGCWSAVMGPNSSEIQLQQNVGYGFATVVTASAAFTAGTWYVIRVDWAVDGTMTVSLWDDTQATQIAATSPYPTGLTAAGGLAIRAFGTGSGNIADMDDIGVVGAACYANCDGSTVQPILNVLDFTCFLNKFAAGDTYANCDQSTTPPVLNVLDFNCFLNRFAVGCS